MFAVVIKFSDGTEIFQKPREGSKEDAFTHFMNKICAGKCCAEFIEDDDIHHYSDFFPEAPSNYELLHVADKGDVFSPFNNKWQLYFVYYVKD